MIGFVRRTVSPWSSSMRRSTPWVLGCCGPMLMIMVSSSVPAVSAERLGAAGPRAGGGVGGAGRERAGAGPRLEQQLGRVRVGRVVQLLGSLPGLGAAASDL